MMKDMQRQKKYWYSWVIAICIFVFSILCIACFGKNISQHLITKQDSGETAIQTKKDNVVKNMDKEKSNEENSSGNKEARHKNNKSAEITLEKEPKETFISNLIDVYHKSAGISEKLISGLNEVWNQSIVKKNYWSRVDSLFTYCMTGEVASTQVICGKQKWLFYKSKTDGDPIADYEGTNRYSEDRMKVISENIRKTQNALADKGIKFAVMIAPNKENIYSEYMPDQYLHDPVSSTDLLIAYLQKSQNPAVSPKRDLLDHHLKRQLYYSYDTHWNQLGAYIGVYNVLDFWDIKIPKFQECKIAQKPLKGNYHYCGEDDLAGMIGLLSSFDDEIEYEVIGGNSFDWEKFEQEQESKKFSHIKNKNAIRNKVLFLVGDSFRSSMIPEFSEVFSDVYVIHRNYYTPEMLDQIKPDYLLAEYVERYSNSLDGVIDLVTKTE